MKSENVKSTQSSVVKNNIDRATKCTTGLISKRCIKATASAASSVSNTLKPTLVFQS